MSDDYTHGDNFDYDNVLVDEIERLTNLLEYARNEIKDGRKEIERLQARVEALEGAVQEQAEDDGLWFISETASEVYLQSALRYLHALIEQDTRALLALEEGVHNEDIDILLGLGWDKDELE